MFAAAALSPSLLYLSSGLVDTHNRKAILFAYSLSEYLHTHTHTFRHKDIQAVPTNRFACPIFLLLRSKSSDSSVETNQNSDRNSVDSAIFAAVVMEQGRLPLLVQTQTTQIRDAQTHTFLKEKKWTKTESWSALWSPIKEASISIQAAAAAARTTSQSLVRKCTLLIIVNKHTHQNKGNKVAKI